MKTTLRKTWMLSAMLIAFGGSSLLGACLGVAPDEERSAGGLSASRGDDGEPLVEMDGEAGECIDDAEGGQIVTCACQCQTPAGNFAFTTTICDPPGCKAINGVGFGCTVFNRRTLAVIATGTVGGCQ